MNTLDIQRKRIISYGAYEAQSLIKKAEFLMNHFETNRSELFKKLQRKIYEQVQLQMICSSK